MNDPSSDHVPKSTLLSNKAEDPLLDNATPIPDTGNGDKQYEKEDGMTGPDKDFDNEVDPSTVKPISGGRMGVTKDGRKINVRGHSSYKRVTGGQSGWPTLQRTDPNTGISDKIGYNPNKK